MSCDHCDLWLQEVLDGVELDASLAEHLLSCSACRDLYESALTLRRGLAGGAIPQAEPDLTDRIVTAVVLDRRRRQRRRRLVAYSAALAACILVGWFLATSRPQPVGQQDGEPVVKKPVDPAPSLRKTVVDAGSAVVDQARRQAGETVDSARSLFAFDTPNLIPDPELPLEPAVGTLVETGQSVGAGLEPMTGSARRAIALFVRDLAPGTRQAKPGS